MVQHPQPAPPRHQQAALGDDRIADDEFGTALVSGGFNGDGFDDLAIGVPGEEIAGGATDMGVVQVIFGGGGNSGFSRAPMAGLPSA